MHFYRHNIHNSEHITSVLNFLSVVLGFNGFVYEFQTISINHTGISKRGLRTVNGFIPFSCNRAASPTKGSTGIIWLGPGSWEDRQWIPMRDARQRWKTQTISQYKEFVSRWLFQSVALEQTELKHETFGFVLRHRSKLWNINQTMVYVSQEPHDLCEDIYFIWGLVKLGVVVLSPCCIAVAWYQWSWQKWI